MPRRLPTLPDTARAFATYSLVPYLGILFCPGAVVVGGAGLFKSYRSPLTPDETGRRACYVSLSVGLVVLAVQLLLWWILYKAPMWAQGL